ncbi:hypothetical protein [Streptomyces sp. NPDC048489]|uniref:hypothetical protein n=1 Tax=Streptomyces sp. NPDC048489 TaxID=3154504 RepID=UPI003413D762
MLDRSSRLDSSTDFSRRSTSKQLLVVEFPVLVDALRMTPIDLPSSEMEVQLNPVEYV